MSALATAVLAALLAAAPAPSGSSRLAGASSPYLLSHASDPVGWYPWGPEAFAEARETGKPVFLSIGYSSCHWCHVMARESFSDPETAALLSERFVPVLVDREERPDVDEVYVTAVQLLTGHSGWPASVFLTPEGEPFYGGGYFPAEQRLGLPAFRDVLRRVHSGWSDRGEDGGPGERRRRMESVAGQLTADVREVLAERAARVEGGPPTAEDAGREVARWKRLFDPEHGGFARPPAFQPKFPNHAGLWLLMDAWKGGDEDAGRQVVATLRAMAAGGLRDESRGGFHRYTVDREWKRPHFEKMLYDNALLAELYAEAAHRIDDGAGGETRDEFERLGRETLGFLLAGMANGEGDMPGAEGFAASLDADEAFYAGEGPVSQAPPAVDRTVLTGWNGLAVAAFARGAEVFGEPRYLAVARRTADLLLSRDGGAPLRHALPGDAPAQLDDYAYLLRGLLALASAEAGVDGGDGSGRWLAAARRLADEMNARLAAPGGGWFHAAEDPLLPLRARTITGSNLPPGNAVAIAAFAELASRLGPEGGAPYRRRAQRALAAFAGDLERFPGSVPGLARAALRFHAATPPDPEGSPGEKKSPGGSAPRGGRR